MRGWWIVVALAACGGESGQPDGSVEPTPDARVLDARVLDAPALDAPALDAPPSPDELTVNATVRCCDQPSGAPAADVAIAVGDQIVATTDSAGHATVTVDGPTTVTAVYPTDSVMATALVTVFAAAAGDTLALGERYRDLSTVTATATITWDAQTAGQTGYLVVDGCTADFLAADATSAPARAYTGCGSPTTDILVVAAGAVTPAGITPLRWTYREDVAVVDAGTIVMPSFQDAGTFSVDVTAIPSGIDNVVVVVTPWLGQAFGPSAFTSGPPADDAFSFTGAWTHGRHAHVEVSLHDPAHQGYIEHGRFVDGAATSASVATAPLPWIDDVAIDVATRTVSWTATGVGAYDTIGVELVWESYPAIAGGAVPVHSWWLIAPPGATSLTWPALPSALATHEPTASDQVTVRVNLLDFDGVSDYAAVRALPEPELRRPNAFDTGATRDHAFSFGSN